MVDSLLVFPPQWSPFQPALSLPSLSAWLKRAGFQVKSLDANVLLYEWLLSERGAQLLASLALRNREWSDDVKATYVATFENVAAFRSDLQQLRSTPAGAGELPTDYAARNYLAIKSLETYLLAVSSVGATFALSPYAFTLSSGNLNARDLERQVAEPSEILARFVDALIEDCILPEKPRTVGLSCIGQEQLYWSLLIGHRLKQRSQAPILVGGTIFSRIFERGVLRPDWFGRYFDVIVRNEGEKPAEQLLANLTRGRSLTEGVPGVVYLEHGRIRSTEPAAPLRVAELPVPDFDDLPLGSYLSSEITLPLLSARGCYWGKCEFCHHGMVYGEKYAPYDASLVLSTVEALAAKYSVRHFAFNDEALPPKTARAIANLFPPHERTGWTFTGLIKFEPFYKRADFQAMHDIGFRSLYIGMESASERVLERMKKKCKRDTIVQNLRDATDAGIWMHCFLFFGFPGETEQEAEETYHFVLDNSAIISSFGAGTFSLEHNAPIFKHTEQFGLKLKVLKNSDADVYYDYDVDSGITALRALEWQEQLTRAASRIENYVGAKWVPRELLLCMLSVMGPQELKQVGNEIRECGGFPGMTTLPSIATRVPQLATPDSYLVINRVSGRALRLGRTAARLFNVFYDHALSLDELRREAPMLFDKLAFIEDPHETSNASAAE